MNYYQMHHQGNPIGRQTPEEIEKTKARVEADPDRFVKWRSRVNRDKFRAYRRQLPDGMFEGIGRKDNG